MPHGGVQGLDGLWIVMAQALQIHQSQINQTVHFDLFDLMFIMLLNAGLLTFIFINVCFIIICTIIYSSVRMFRVFMLIIFV